MIAAQINGNQVDTYEIGDMTNVGNVLTYQPTHCHSTSL
jgi:hypothetical protein